MAMSNMIHYMVSQVERRNRFAVERTGRYRLVDEAKAGRTGAGSHLVTGLRHRSGGALIRIGSHLAGAPRPEPGTITRPAW